MAKSDFYVVLQAFVTTVDDKQELYQQGEIVDSSDPVFKRSPELFGPIAVRGSVSAPAPTPEPVVEQASAAPGEQRETAGKPITTAGLKGRSSN
jgi:hypothetical protein